MAVATILTLAMNHKITEDTWSLQCRSSTQKRNLLDYAKSCGLHVFDNTQVDDDEALVIEGTDIPEGVICLYTDFNDCFITEVEFREMCQAYADERAR